MPSTSEPSTSKPSTSDTAQPTDAGALQAEVTRLRELVGPDEAAYTSLKIELWAARDSAFGAEMAAGELRGQVKVLEGQLAQANRNRRWMVERIKAPLRRVKAILR